MVGTNDFDRAKAFYDTVLATLGVKPGMVNVAATGHKRAFWMHAGGMFGISEPINNEPATASNGSTIGFVCDSLEQVKAFHDFFMQFAQSGSLDILALVDPALRHLPEAMRGRINPLADKDEAIPVHQHEARAGAIGQAVGVHAGLASMNCMAAIMRSRSRWVLGTAPRRLVKEWVTPRISRNTQSRPASTSALA